MGVADGRRQNGAQASRQGGEGHPARRCSTRGRTSKGLAAKGLGLLLAMGLLAGCAGRPGPDVLQPTDATVPGAKQETILVASTRERDARPGTFYNGERAPLSFATVDMSVPPTHQPGAIEWPKNGVGNPATDMVVREAAYIDSKQHFLTDLNAELAKRPKGQKIVFIFVHGYNTQFSEALYRFSQMAVDSDSTAVPLLFTWASRAKTEAYVYDNNSATIARDALEETIRLALASNAERVSIMAHSMGNWVTVEALRQMRMAGELKSQGHRIGNVILAAPDIDVDVFKSQLRRFGKPERPFVIIVSRDDKALGFSNLIAGGKTRVGAYANDEELVDMGAVVVDMTDVKALDEFNHGKFAQLAEIAPQMRAIVSRQVTAIQGSTPQSTAPAAVEVEKVKVFGLNRIFGTSSAAASVLSDAPPAPAAQ